MLNDREFWHAFEFELILYQIQKNKRLNKLFELQTVHLNCKLQMERYLNLFFCFI